MGKLLRKFLHGIVPSWFTKIKISDGSSHRKLLLFFRGGTTPPPKSVTSSPKYGSTNTASPSVGMNSYEGTPGGTMDQFAISELESEAPATPQARNKEEDENSLVEAARSRRYKRKSECLEEWSASSSSNSNSHRWSSKRPRKVISADLPDCLCEVVGDSSAVVKYAEDPDQELWESMVEMIVGNGLWELHNLECLLYCYLSLNDPQLYHTIERTFLRALKDLERTS